jgi:hypothetical protein
MINPVRYRPQHDDDEWADNIVSNGFAWASTTLLPSWCAAPDHWTSKVTASLWTDCPCCLLWRGISLGLFAGLAIGLLF